MDEEYYKERVRIALRNCFEFHEEVEGTFPISNLKVIIDFVLFPNEDLISRGFPAVPFGIEVKSPDSKGSVSKCIDAIWQCCTYCLSDFHGINLAFVLLYPDVLEFIKHDNVHKYDLGLQDIEMRTQYHTLNRIMQRANIGSLLIESEDWKIAFGTSGFFSSKRGKTQINNLGFVRRVGNRKLNYNIKTHSWC